MKPVPAIPTRSSRAILARQPIQDLVQMSSKSWTGNTQNRVPSSKVSDLLERVNTSGELLSLIRAGTAVTRADLARHTGLARSTVAQRVDALLDSGLLLEAGGTPPTGGRPATALAFNHQSGVVLVADLGATHTRVAVTDLAGTPLAERAQDLDIALGPEAALTWVSARF